MHSQFFKKIILLIPLLAIVSLHCSGGRQFSLAPVKIFDPDNRSIPPPEEKEENQIWDIIDMTFFYQVEKLLDLNWSGRQIGKLMSLSGARQADNVNALDEVPNSSWYTNRHFQNPMTVSELKQGPNVTSGPDKSGVWTITRGKFEGGTPGFTIRDSKGNSYILKFDAKDYPEMGSSAEVISTKILYAAGYHVPQNTIEYFDPNILRIGENVEVLDQGVKRPMVQSDLEKMLNGIPRRSDGKIRVLASKFVDGKPVGVWEYKGTRSDDPNDLVQHEHRRELRGLRIISSWLNDADRRAANTLAVYTEENGSKFIKHYLIDMGSTLGSNNKFPHAPKYGYEYLVDPRTIGLSLISLGIYRKPWEFITAHLDPRYPSVGYFEAEIFKPATWVPTYPNPAFEYCTLRDAYWGAKIVMSFSDSDIQAIVETAQMSNPNAEDYLIETLTKRRDKIGRYWFSKMNPLDKFHLEWDNEGRAVLKFKDLAVETNINSKQKTHYIYQFFYNDNPIYKTQTSKTTEIVLFHKKHSILDKFLETKNIEKEENKIFSVKIFTKRNDSPLSKFVEVYFYYPGIPGKGKIVGIVREE